MNNIHSCSYSCDMPECIKAQRDELSTAAAQEAVAYWRVTFRMYPENIDCCETFVRGPDRPTLDTLGISPRPVQIISTEPLYAAPVTAAPAGVTRDDAEQVIDRIMGEYGFSMPSRAYAELVDEFMCTPAAPWIDPAALARDIHHAIADAGLAPMSPADNHALREVIRSVIDASPKGELESWKRGTKACAEVLGQVTRELAASPKGEDSITRAFDRAVLEPMRRGAEADSPKGGSDPWRGLYAPERAPNRDEYGCLYHPDIPSWDDEREESIAPLLKAQGFDLQCVPGDFSDEAMEEGGERYWQEMREWNPEPEGDGWRLVAIYDTEDGPYSMFVKPLAQAGDAEVQP